MCKHNATWNKIKENYENVAMYRYWNAGREEKALKTHYIMLEAIVVGNEGQMNAASYFWNFKFGLHKKSFDIFGIYYK